MTFSNPECTTEVQPPAYDFRARFGPNSDVFQAEATAPTAESMDVLASSSMAGDRRW